jgi:hypothetical protein
MSFDRGHDRREPDILNYREPFSADFEPGREPKSSPRDFKTTTLIDRGSDPAIYRKFDCMARSCYQESVLFTRARIHATIGRVENSMYSPTVCCESAARNITICRWLSRVVLRLVRVRTRISSPFDRTSLHKS